MTRSDDNIAGAYKPRYAKDSPFHSCVENHFEELESVRDDLYAPLYGFWRPYITDVIYRYLDCGDLRCGFARVRCDHCGHEYLLAFSCKGRHFCPSCHQKRVVEYGEWLLTDVLKKVPHRHWVFGIPKRLRIYFMYDHSPLGKLSTCAWNVMSAFLKSAESGVCHARRIPRAGNHRRKGDGTVAVRPGDDRGTGNGATVLTHITQNPTDRGIHKM